ncbi:MAG: TetR/AcrR family transcriptional regulator, partial [Pseudomonadota bacterium]
ISRRHKQDMTEAIAGLLPAGPQQARQAQAVALAVDGAIVRAQFDGTPDAALETFGLLLAALRVPGAQAQNA